jgi:hypothetical protein
VRLSTSRSADNGIERQFSIARLDNYSMRAITILDVRGLQPRSPIEMQVCKPGTWFVLAAVSLLATG